MNTILLRTEAIEARLTTYSCPCGTVGRGHALRLRLRFQPVNWYHSLALGSSGICNTRHNVTLQETFNLDLRREQHSLPQDAIEQPSGLRVPVESNSSSSLRNASDPKASAADGIRETLDSSIDLAHPRRITLPPHMARAYHGDTFGLPFPSRRSKIQYRDLSGDNLRQALRNENPHAILSTLLKLIKDGDDGYQGYEIFHLLPPNTFTEILRCLDPEYFVGRYIKLHKTIYPRMPRYTALQPQKKHGPYQFSVNFMARIKVIIAARRSKGLILSLSDYKCLLRCAGAVENPRASQAIWYAMSRDAIKPDTECYNYYLSGILRVGISNGMQKSYLRIPPSQLLVRSQEPLQIHRGYYEQLGVNIKHMTTKVFTDMAKNGVVGDEGTFCLLMISLARVGDVQGVKAIMSKVWGVNVDDLTTKSEGSLEEPKAFPLDSPFRPSQTLLFALAHSFGINNAIPTALHLIDYVSRKYSITIPIEMWEDLLGLTSALSMPQVSKKGVDMRPPFLPPEAVSTLWAALTTEPYMVTPTMEMYDKLIISLIRRQRFGEAQGRMEEALHLHVKKVNEYGEKVAIEKQQSFLLEAEGDSESSERVRGSIVYQNYLTSQRDKTFHHLSQNRSRQYIYRWCQIFMRQATYSLIDNPKFTFINFPRFVWVFGLFMPRYIEYQTPTGFIHFPSGSLVLSKRLAQEKEALEWSPPKINASQGGPSSREAVLEIDGDDDDGDGSTPPKFQLESDEMFGKS